MAIISATATEVVQYCPRCEAEHTHQIADLTLGTEASPNAMRLPQCPCGRTEELWVTHDLPAEGPQQHRRLVNRLGKRLRALGQTHAVHDFAQVPEPLNVGDAADLDFTARSVSVERPVVQLAHRKRWDAELEPRRIRGELPAKPARPAPPEPGERAVDPNEARAAVRAAERAARRRGPDEDPPADPPG